MRLVSAHADTFTYTVPGEVNRSNCACRGTANSTPACANAKSNEIWPLPINVPLCSPLTLSPAYTSTHSASILVASHRKSLVAFHTGVVVFARQLVTTRRPRGFPSPPTTRITTNARVVDPASSPRVTVASVVPPPRLSAGASSSPL